MTFGSWYRVARAEADPSVVDIHIIDFIGDWWQDAANRFWGENIGITARAFVEELAKLPAAVKTIRVHINSPGGDVQAGINIANALREQASKGRTVETHIDGLAASIASVIAMAGSKVVMADNALMMIHDPWSIEMGNAADLRKTADVLDTMRDQIVATYQWHTKEEPTAIAAWMAAETWMSATEALERGFVTEIAQGLKAAASLSRTALAKLRVPDALKATVDAFIQPDPPPAPPFDALPIVSACTKAGLPELAEALVRAKATPAAVDARLAEERQARAARTERETSIRQACALAKVPELADGYVAGAMSLADVKAHLVVVRARLDKVEVDNSLHPDQPAGGKRTVDRAAAYRNFTQQPTA